MSEQELEPAADTLGHIGNVADLVDELVKENGIDRVQFTFYFEKRGAQRGLLFVGIRLNPI